MVKFLTWTTLLSLKGPYNTKYVLGKFIAQFSPYEVINLLLSYINYTSKYFPKVVSSLWVHPFWSTIFCFTYRSERTTFVSLFWTLCTVYLQCEKYLLFQNIWILDLILKNCPRSIIWARLGTTTLSYGKISHMDNFVVPKRTI